MTHEFSRLLDHWIDSRPNTSVRQIADSISMDYSDLYRVKRGEKAISRANLEKLIRYVDEHFSRADALHLTRAYVVDQIPDEFQDLIAVRTLETPLIQESPTDPLEALLERWLQRARKDRQFANFLKQHDAILHSPTPGEDIARIQSDDSPSQA